jgi:hypothetical protein
MDTNRFLPSDRVELINVALTLPPLRVEMHDATVAIETLAAPGLFDVVRTLAEEEVSVFPPVYSSQPTRCKRLPGGTSLLYRRRAPCVCCAALTLGRCCTVQRDLRERLEAIFGIQVDARFVGGGMTRRCDIDTCNKPMSNMYVACSRCEHSQCGDCVVAFPGFVCCDGKHQCIRYVLDACFFTNLLRDMVSAPHQLRLCRRRPWG